MPCLVNKRQGFDIAQSASIHFEPFLREQMRNIGARTGKTIVDADYICSRGEQAVAKMRPAKSGTAGDKYSLLQVHESLSLMRAWCPPVFLWLIQLIGKTLNR